MTPLQFRVAWYARLIKNNKLDLNEQDAKEWLEKIDTAIEEQYKILDRGGLPSVFNLKNVRLLYHNASCVLLSNERRFALQ